MPNDEAAQTGHLGVYRSLWESYRYALGFRTAPQKFG